MTRNPSSSDLSQPFTLTSPRSHRRRLETIVLSSDDEIASPRTPQHSDGPPSSGLTVDQVQTPVKKWDIAVRVVESSNARLSIPEEPGELSDVAADADSSVPVGITAGEIVIPDSQSLRNSTNSIPNILGGSEGNSQSARVQQSSQITNISLNSIVPSQGETSRSAHEPVTLENLDRVFEEPELDSLNAAEQTGSASDKENPVSHVQGKGRAESLHKPGKLVLHRQRDANQNQVSLETGDLACPSDTHLSQDSSGGSRIPVNDSTTDLTRDNRLDRRDSVGVRTIQPSNTGEDVHPFLHDSDVLVTGGIAGGQPPSLYSPSYHQETQDHQSSRTLPQTPAAEDLCHASQALYSTTESSLVAGGSADDNNAESTKRTPARDINSAGRSREGEVARASEPASVRQTLTRSVIEASGQRNHSVETNDQRNPASQPPCDKSHPSTRSLHSGPAQNISAHRTSALSYSSGSQGKVLTSSSLPQAPSQLLQGHKDSVMPSRPQTPSQLSSTGYGSQGGLSYKEKRGLQRQPKDESIEARRARSIVRSNQGTSAALPVSEPSKTTALSRRSPATPNVSGMMSTKTSSEDHAAPFNSTLPPALNLLIPLPFQDPSFENYDQAFQYHYRNGGILDRLFAGSEDDESEDLRHEAESLLQRMCRQTLHLDLIDEQPPTQYDSKKVAEYAAHVSSKFSFLASVIQTAQDLPRHIAIFVEPGRPLAIANDFLHASDVSFECPSLGSSANTSGKIKVSLLNSSSIGETVRDSDCEPADLIVGMDSSFDVSDKRVSAIRARAAAHQSPTLTLVTPYSMEHVTSASGSRTSGMGLGSLKDLFKMAARVRKMAGNPHEQPADATTTGQQVVKALLQGHTNLIASLPSMDSYVLPRKSMSKRVADLNLDSSTSAKRQKSTTPSSALEPSNASVTRVSDSTVAKKSNTVNAQSDVGVSQASSSVVREARMSETILNLEAAVRTFETQNQTLWSERNALQKALADQDVLLTRIATLEESGTMHRQKTSGLQDDLKTSHDLLAGSSNADTRRLYELEEKVKDIPKLESRLKNFQQEVGSIMRIYQDASNLATAHAATIIELEVENQTLARKASGEAIRVRETFQDTALAQARSEVNKANAHAVQLGRALEKQADDAAALREENERLHIRLGPALITRGSMRGNSPGAASLSVPGQSKAGSRAGTPAVGVSQAGSRVGSRQGTPQPHVQAAKPRGPTINLSRSLLRE